MFEAYSDTDCDRQLAMVIDLNKCMGCQTCSVACKQLWTSGEGQEHMWWNKVNTMPGEGSPRKWEEKGGGFSSRGFKVGPWRFFGGEACESEVPSRKDFGTYMDLPHDSVVKGEDGEKSTVPRRTPEWTYNWDEDRGGGEYPNSYFFYLPRLCNHCSRPACLEACPRDAMYKRKKDGIVLIDEDRCEGYRFCMEACPYKVIYFNPEHGTVVLGEDNTEALNKAQKQADPGEDLEDGMLFETAEMSEDPSTRMIQKNGSKEEVAAEGIAQKCVGCFARLEENVAPACVRQCPGRARFFGFLEEEGTPVHKLVRRWEVALPLHPEFHTDPNVYYVPPLSSSKIDEEGRPQSESRIPLDYLKSLFGSDVDAALETLREERQKVKNGEHSELMNLLIGWRWPDNFLGNFTNHPQDVLMDESHEFGGPREDSKQSD